MQLYLIFSKKYGIIKEKIHKKGEKMPTYRVFTMRLCRYLCDQGFKYIAIEPHRRRPEFNTWVFEETNELLRAVDAYMRDLQEKRR